MSTEVAGYDRIARIRGIEVVLGTDRLIIPVVRSTWKEKVNDLISV